MNPKEFKKQDLKEIKILYFAESRVVFKAEYHGKIYAIKKYKKDNIDEEDNIYYKNALNKEIEILRIMSQFENSTKFYLDYEDDEFYVLILEFCAKNLQEYLENQKTLSSSEILYIMEGLNKVFKYMINNNILHRDIKPSNILIKYDDNLKGKYKYIPKVTDYGFSRFLKNGVASTELGTPLYQAPEIGNENPYTNKSDLFSIGVMMYKLYFNEFPFKSYKKKIKYEDKKLKDCDDKILDDLINKLLIIDPKKRITWEEYFNHPFFKGNKLVEDLNNQLNILKIEENKLIKFDDKNLLNMLYQNEIEKQEIENNPGNIITLQECLNLKDDSVFKDSFFILGVLGKYLEEIGISVRIEKEYKRNKESRNYHKNIIQSICNSYILKDKYLLYFDLDYNRINELFSEDKERDDFNKKLKQLIMKTYHLEEDELLITNQKRENQKFTVVMVIKSNFNKKITKEELLKNFGEDKELKTLSKIDIEKITPIIKLRTSMLSYKNNNKGNEWGKDKTKGGEVYNPPQGWANYGINIFQVFDDKNNDWISDLHKPGEWCVGYCGLKGIKTKYIEQLYENDDDIRHPGNKVGIGVYCTCLPSILEKDTETINVNGENYKVGLMLRIKPDKIRASAKNENIWILNGNEDEIRPYGILLKNIKNN